MIDDKFFAKLLSTYLSNKNDNEGNIELEFRFKPYKYKETSYDFSTFSRIRRKMIKKFGTPSKIETIISKQEMDIREDTVDGKISFINKKRLITEEFIDYKTKIHLSNEYIVSKPFNFSPDLVRKKNRTSITVGEGKFRIDLSIVDNIKTGIHPFTTYEIEMEILDLGNVKLNEINSILKNIYRYILDTNIVYGVKEQNEIFNFVLNTLNIKGNEIRHNNIFVEARNLKYQDLVCGGLVNNKLTNFAIAHKADGVRKLCIIHKTGIWLFTPPNNFNKISSIDVVKGRGTIFVGELIPKESRVGKSAPKDKYWIMVYDCISIKNTKVDSGFGNSAIQEKSYEFRMQHAINNANFVREIVPPGIFSIKVKSYKEFSTAPEFFNKMNEMIIESKMIIFKTDGFIITPIAPKYFLPTCNNYNENILSNCLEICKIKPKEKETIDFIFYRNSPHKGLYLKEKNIEKKFTGSIKNPLNEKDIIFDNEITKNIDEGSIVEFAYDFTNKKLYPYKLREDKDNPNSLRTGNAVWKIITDPIDFETLKGNTFKLSDKYHNNIKRDLFITSVRKVVSKLGNTKLNLLDLGSGRGGDLSKMEDFSKIIMVEPDSKNIEELVSRLDKSKMKNKVTVLTGRSQDTEIITESIKENFGDEKCHVISIMLSMSFLWEKKEYVDKFIKTLGDNIREDGIIIFLTVDGDAIEQLFEPKMERGYNVEEIKLPYIFTENSLDFGDRKMKYNRDDKSVDVSFEKNSIVGDAQREWLVRIDDLRKGLDKYGFKLSSIHRADKEPFLNEREQMYTKLYSYGYFEHEKYISDQPNIIYKI